MKYGDKVEIAVAAKQWWIGYVPTGTFAGGGGDTVWVKPDCECGRCSPIPFHRSLIVDAP